MNTENEPFNELANYKTTNTENVPLNEFANYKTTNTENVPFNELANNKTTNTENNPFNELANNKTNNTKIEKKATNKLNIKFYFVKCSLLYELLYVAPLSRWIKLLYKLTSLKKKKKNIIKKQYGRWTCSPYVS
jgi:hypothetical protein